MSFRLFLELGIELSLADLFLTGLGLGCSLLSVKSLLFRPLKLLLFKLDLSLALGLLLGDSHSLTLLCLQSGLFGETRSFSVLGGLLSGLSGLLFKSLRLRFIGKALKFGLSSGLLGGSLGDASLFGLSGESLLLSSESGRLLLSGDSSLLCGLASGLLLCSDSGQLCSSPGCLLFLSFPGRLSGDAGLASLLLELTLLGFLLKPLHLCKPLGFLLSKSLLLSQSSGFLLGR